MCLEQAPVCRNHHPMVFCHERSAVTLAAPSAMVQGAHGMFLKRSLQEDSLLVEDRLAARGWKRRPLTRIEEPNDHGAVAMEETVAMVYDRGLPRPNPARNDYPGTIVLPSPSVLKASRLTRK